jgi:hypothetical protein
VERQHRGPGHVEVDRARTLPDHGYSFGGWHHITADREFALQEPDTMPDVNRPVAAYHIWPVVRAHRSAAAIDHRRSFWATPSLLPRRRTAR